MCIYHISLKKTIRSVPPRSTATAERGLLRAEGMKAGTAGTGLTVPLALICLRSATKMPWESMDYMGIPWGYHGDTMGIPWGYHGNTMINNGDFMGFNNLMGF